MARREHKLLWSYADGKCAVREFQPGDAAAAAEVLARCYDLFKISHGGHIPDQIVEDRVKPRWTAEQMVVMSAFTDRLVISRQNEIIGSVGIARQPGHWDWPSRGIVWGEGDIWPRDYQGYLTFNFALDPACRGQSLSHILVAGMSAFGLTRGIKEFFYVAEPTLHGIYCALGWRHQPQQDIFFPDVIDPGYNLQFTCQHRDQPMPDQKIKQMYFVLPVKE